MSELVIVNREELLAELRQVFDEKTSETLLSVLDKVAIQTRSTLVTHEDFNDIRQILAETAAIQKRSEERLDRIETAIGELSRTTDKRLEQLSKQVRGLSETVGGDIEDIGYIVLYDVLKREFGWDVGVLERTWLMWDKQPEEVNIFGKATDPSRQGKTIWIVGEAKHNLTSREVSRFVKQLGKARRNLIGEIFPVCFCYRARPEVQKQVLGAGIRLVFSYGKLV